MKKKMAMLLAAVMAVTVLGGCGTSQTKQESAQTPVSYTHLDVYKRQVYHK